MVPMMKFTAEVLAVVLSLALLSPVRARADDAFEFFKEEAQAITVASARPETVFNSVSNVTAIDREARVVRR